MSGGDKQPDALVEWMNTTQLIHHIYPCTIIAARYGGHYEGGTWLAFNCDHDRIPWEATGDDISCGNFWDLQARGMLNYAPLNVVPHEDVKPKLIVVGKGDTPNLAVVDLVKQLGIDEPQP